MQETIDSLINTLSEIKNKQKMFSAQEALIKALLIESLNEQGLDGHSTKNGTVRLQRRNEKSYSFEIKAMEEELKEAKKLADDMGDYTINATKESIIFTFPKQ